MLKVSPRLVVDVDEIYDVVPRFLKIQDTLLKVRAFYDGYYDSLIKIRPRFGGVSDAYFRCFAQGLFAPVIPTWLMAEAIAVQWVQVGVESGFLVPTGSAFSYLGNVNSGSQWMNNEDGAPDFDTEGEETYISE